MSIIGVFQIGKTYLVYRLYPYLCNAVKNFINDHVPDTINSGRDFYVNFVDMSTLHKYVILSCIHG